MMARQPTLSQEARIKLAAQLINMQKADGSPVDPVQRGTRMAGQTPHQPDNRHSRALVNAVAVGPGRVGDDERRLMLARLLAQRTQREADNGGMWTALADQLISDIEALEKQSSSSRQRLAEKPTTLSPAVLDEERRRLGMQLVERFLHALDRAVSAQEGVRQEGQQKSQAGNPGQGVVEQRRATQAQGGDDGR